MYYRFRMLNLSLNGYEYNVRILRYHFRYNRLNKGGQHVLYVFNNGQQYKNSTYRYMFYIYCNNIDTILKFIHKNKYDSCQYFNNDTYKGILIFDIYGNFYMNVPFSKIIDKDDYLTISRKYISIFVKILKDCKSYEENKI